MSADNWRICPMCHQKAEQARQAALQKAQKAYGRVPPQKYARMLDAADVAGVEVDTLREDWEIATDLDGVLRVSYDCSCHRCGFEQSFKHKQAFELSRATAQNGG